MQELAVLAARAMGTQRQFAVTADNIANVNTQGYRRHELDFKEAVARHQGKGQGAETASLSYVADRSSRLILDQGSLERTNNPLHAAIGGNGFFAISVNGTTQYTRRGEFLLSNEGTLTDTNGNPVLDNAGAQIQLPQDTKNIMIGRDGTLSTEQGQIAQLGVYVFSKEDAAKLVRAGQTSYVSVENAQPSPVETPSVIQGALEGSNVNAVKEMVTLQDVSKAYQSSMKTISNLEETEQRMIRTLGGLQ